MALYTFVIFPHIDGFPLFVCAMALTCIPIGILMAGPNPTLANTMLPIILGLNIADLQNRYSTDITVYLNSLVAQNIGIIIAGGTLGFVRALTLYRATRRLVTENGQALAHLTDDRIPTCLPTLDRMTHRSALALVRAPKLRQDQQRIASRTLLDLRISRVLVQMRDVVPLLSAALRDKWHPIRIHLMRHFARRKGLEDTSSIIKPEIVKLKQVLEHSKHNHETLRFIGLVEMLEQSLEETA